MLPAGAVLMTAAVAESIARTASAGMNPWFVVLVAVLAVGSSAPVALLPAAGAAVTVGASVVLSVVPFACLSIGGGMSLLVTLLVLGRSGSQLLAAVLAVPVPILALIGVLGDSWSGEQVILLLVLAPLAPAAAWAGTAHRSLQLSTESDRDRDLAIGALLEHTARGERARIARELHDVVAHHISMIAVQAESARLTTVGLPPAGAEKFTAIGGTARSALTEMRRLLGVLRTDTDAAAEPVPRQPQPGLRQLTELLDQAREASGAGTRLIIDGSPDPLDPGIELAAFRIVQEALTNVRRHAPGAAVDVELHYTDDAVLLRIRDNGPGPADGTFPATGHGLLGMHERAAAVGGRLWTGPAAGGGFLVEARLPITSGQQR